MIFIMKLPLLLLFTVLGISRIQAAIPNVFCMIEHCGNEMKDCMADSDCKNAMICVSGCGTSNQTCEFDCIYSYEDDIFDNLMKCIVTDHKCMDIPPPNPPVVCHRPTKVATSFDIGSLNGTWYIVRGKNPIYDCFNCQVTTFVPTQKDTFSASEHFDVNAIDGSIKHRSVTDTVTQWNMTSPGFLKYHSMQMGHETISEYRVLDFGKDYLFMYYCGSISANYFFEGSIVYSKSTSLSTDTISKLTSVAATAGLNFNSFCKPNHNNCHN